MDAVSGQQLRMMVPLVQILKKPHYDHKMCIVIIIMIIMMLTIVVITIMRNSSDQHGIKKVDKKINKTMLQDLRHELNGKNLKIQQTFSYNNLL